jgi:tetratricopeptide (TPR) repeat protein
MKPNQEKINNLIEAQFHYFESGQLEEAETVVDSLMKPLSSLGRYPELLGILEKTIELVDDPDDRVYIYQARALMALGRPDDALAVLDLVELKIGDNRELKAAILLDKGTSLRRLGEFSRAEEIIEDYQEAYGIYEDLRKESESEEFRRMFRENQGTCLFGEGNIYQYFLDDGETAMERYRDSRAVFDEVKSPDGIADATKQMGEIYASPQFHEYYSVKLADDSLAQALAIYRENDYQKGVLETLYQLGRLHRVETERALELFGEYLALAKRLGLVREEAVAKRHVAELQFQIARRSPETGVDAESKYLPLIQMLDEAIRVLSLFQFDAWSQRSLMNCYDVLGEIWALLGKDEKALESFQEGLKVGHNPVFESRKKGDVLRRIRLLLKVAQILFKKDRSSEAERLIADHADDFEQLELHTPSREQVQELIIRLTKGG